MALHALAYCERLFYLEEVEELRVADAAVWEGRRLHAELGEPAEVTELTLESETLGIRGRLDAVRTREGLLYPVEHKKGRSRRGEDGKPAAWDSDRLQAVAYAMLLEEDAGRAVAEARIRYHADGMTVRVAATPESRSEVLRAVARARVLSATTERPAVTKDERKCVRCSLAPVCLPEESRWLDCEVPEDRPTPVRLFPPDTERRSLHVVTQGARIGRSGDALAVAERDQELLVVGAREVSDVVIHGHGQITTQALRLCAAEEIPVHFVTTSGAYVGVFTGGAPAVQRRLRQLRALSRDEAALPLARRLIQAKIENQLRHLLRSSRKSPALRERMAGPIDELRRALRGAARARLREDLMGQEGLAARGYFAGLGELVDPAAGAEMRPAGRSRRPPADRFNALLSMGYSLLYRDLVSAILRVGLEPALGILHQPRSSAFPLALDLMELFRTPVVDMAVLGAVNRRSFDPSADFAVTGKQVWLSDPGRRKLLDVYERRKHEEYRHAALDYSLSYGRMMELEVRLLEKEWTGEAGLFARLRIR